MGYHNKMEMLKDNQKVERLNNIKIMYESVKLKIINNRAKSWNNEDS